jgi:CheY-like chemotaxis protein
MPKILLIEDNEENRDALSRRLERRGYEVIMATDGKTGLALAESEAPDIILLDMSLPEIDGWKVARTLKDSETTREISIIALTAHAESGDREKAIGAGCDDYHTKPAELMKLLAQIQGMLKNPPK